MYYFTFTSTCHILWSQGLGVTETVKHNVYTQKPLLTGDPPTPCLILISLNFDQSNSHQFYK